ncbi:hypothetical protein [Novosphingobium sp.]|uniref:hypothetical protein n=1 Tax=Novosphingobium sp. TaxID=1874826 RepID=UPI00286B52B6|nr:hypothetical protein [Novosphingobium sp.]
MALFKSDLFRAFTIGFMLGVAALVSVLGSPFEQSIADQVIPAATAAPVLPDQTMALPAEAAQR